MNESRLGISKRAIIYQKALCLGLAFVSLSGFLQSKNAAALEDQETVKVSPKKPVVLGWRQDRGWSLEETSDGVQVFTKEVAGSPLKAFRGVTQVKTTLSALVALLEDTEAAPLWLYETRLVKRVASLGAKKQIRYSVNDAPFPVSDRDLYFESNIEQLPETGVVLVHLKGIPDYKAPEKEYVRISSFEGEWRFEPLLQGIIKVTYQAHANPGGQLPSWLINSIVVDTPLNTLKGLVSLVQAPKYQQARVEWIQEPTK
jgi:hypothetical protein